MRALALAVACALATGCGGAVLDARADAIAQVIAKARERNAVECAPVELAMAESHHDFALQERAEGRYYQAKAELAIAERNANAALEKSPAGRCAEAPAAVAAPTDEDSDGDGVPNSVDDCPRKPEDVDGFADADGCPDSDNDADGLADSVDDCPDEAEDRDAFADEDGCPDVDNDGDGLSDRLDECPDEAEDDDGVDDDDGCPDCDGDGDGVPECPEAIDRCPDVPAETADGCPAYENVVVTETRIEIRQTVYFDTNRSTIQRRSHALLDEVARALQDNPRISVRVEGHTDSRGKAGPNLRLSQERAEAVRDYLIARGISPSRMVAKGYGETRPIADNRTRAGREQNRRVEFVILDR